MSGALILRPALPTSNIGSGGLDWTGFCIIDQDRERGRNARIERWAGRNSGIERDGGTPDREKGENFRLERHGRTL